MAEIKNMVVDGKMTLYTPDGQVINEVFSKGKSVLRNKVQKPEDAYFGDGKPLNHVEQMNPMAMFGGLA